MTDARLSFSRCALCGGKGMVMETRHNPENVRRRRACPDCGARWTTVEMVVSVTLANGTVLGKGAGRNRGARTVSVHLAVGERKPRA